MLRTISVALLAILSIASVAPAQTPGWQFRWHKGQVLTYRVEHVSSATEVADGKTTGFASKLTLTKRWQINDVDTDGTATLELSLTAMRHEMTPPDGKPLFFDSADLEHSDAEMKKDLSRYVGSVLAVLRVDAYGRVVEVKESKHGPASRFEIDLPFKLIVPAADVREGNAWERKYTITLDPPLGTGEKYDARQRYTCKALKDGEATVAFTTTIAKLPESLADQRPLLPMMTEGDVVFDVKAGMMKSAKVRIDKTLKEHQGAGSSYRLQSTYREELVAGPNN